MEWYERGRQDFADGVSRAAAPTPEGKPAGDEWRLGWDEAASAAETDKPPPGVREVAEVSLVMRDGVLFMVDASGRMLGRQQNVVVEQDATGGDISCKVHVTFVGNNLTEL